MNIPILKTTTTFFVCETIALWCALLFCHLGNGFAQQLYKRDSLKIAEIYELARTNSDRNPTKAKQHLYQLVSFIDSLNLAERGSSKYAIERKATALHFLSYFERRETNFEEAALLAQKSIDLKLQHGLDSLLATSYLQKAKVWQLTFQHEEALDLLLKADSVATTYNQDGQLLEIYSSLGSTYNAISDTVKARNFYLKSLRLADRLGSNYQIALAYSNYASFLRLIDNYGEGLPYLKKAIALHKESNNKIGLESGYYALGLYYNETNQPQEAIVNLERAISLSQELKNTATLPFRYKAISASYKMMDNFKEAYRYQELYQEALRKRNDLEKIKRMAQAEEELEYQKRKVADSIQFAQQKQVEEAKLQRTARNRILVTVLGFALVLGLVIFLYIKNKKRIRKQTEENVLLNEQVETKKEEINDLVSETIRQIKSKEQIVEKLQKLSAENDEVSLKSILADLKASKADNAKLVLIKENIAKANYDFVKKLRSQHPQLTKTDEEICSLIRIGLNRKQIANLRNTSVEAVKSSRYRLKKKLNLSSEQDLDKYINLL